MIMVKLFTRSMNSKIFISKRKKEFFLNEFNKKLLHHQRKSKNSAKFIKHYLIVLQNTKILIICHLYI